MIFRTPPWWRHQMETFSALLAICAGNSSVPGEFPAQRPLMRGFDIFFDLRLNKRLSKQPWGWWFETPSWSLWRQCNDLNQTLHSPYLALVGELWGDYRMDFGENYTNHPADMPLLTNHPRIYNLTKTYLGTSSSAMKHPSIVGPN